MINTYRYNANRNTVSHILQGKNGLTVRYNFERGNVVTNQKPELILRNKFAQDLLESSDLFKQGLVSLVSSIAEPSDVVEETPKEDTPTEQKNVIEEASVRTNADLVNFVNQVDNRTEKNAFTTPARALKWASEHYYKFPNYNPD